MKKQVLIVATNIKWVGISRLPQALNNVGLEVSAYCPRGSFLSLSRNLKKCIQYRTPTYSRTKFFYIPLLIRIIQLRPDFIIPGDEEAVYILQNLANLTAYIPGMKDTNKLIRKSLYPKKFDKTTLQKHLFISLCTQLKIPVPKNHILIKNIDALNILDQLNYPVVLKRSSSYGGSGVFICQNRNELRDRIISEKNHLLSKIKNIIKKIFFVNIIEKNLPMSIQQYIEGTVGMCSFFASNGKLMSANSMLKIKTHPNKTGPSSVVQSFNNPQIIEYLRRIIKELNYTGFGALDFILEEKSKKLFIIELNPRPVPVSHFGNKIANDLCNSCAMTLEGKSNTFHINHKYTVALFPNETKRDSTSEFLITAFHDVPKNEDELKSALIQSL